MGCGYPKVSSCFSGGCDRRCVAVADLRRRIEETLGSLRVGQPTVSLSITVRSAYLAQNSVAWLL